MQLNSVYLYPKTVNVYLNLSSAWQTERYRNVYNQNLKVFRGGDNRIDLQIKNSDQKAASIVGYTPVFVVVNRDNEQVLKKDVEVMDAALGRAYVVLSEARLRDLNTGFYNYSILLEARTAVDTGYIVTERKSGYVDSQYGATATLEVFGDVQGEPVDSKEYKDFSEVRPSAVGDLDDPFFYSSLIDADYEITGSNGLHTFAFYMQDYSGTVEIEASLDISATPKEWVTVSTIEYIGKSLTYHNVEGKYRWFQIKHTPGKVISQAEFTVAQTISNAYQVSVRNVGSGYRPGDTITIIGSRLGGETPGQNLVITIETVNSVGAIQTISHIGNSYSGVRTFVVAEDTNLSRAIDKILYR